MPDWERIGNASGDEPRQPRPPEQGRGNVRREMPELGLEALHVLVHGSREGVILADANGTIRYANPASGRLLGLAPEDLLGRKGGEVCRPEYLFMAREVMARSLAAPLEPIQFTFDTVGHKGSVVTLDATVVNHLATQGVEALVGYIRESTSTAGELGEAYRALFDNALVGLGVADMQGNLLAFNDAMLQPGGYTREEILRIGNVAKLYGNDVDRGRVLQILRAKGYVWRERVPFLRKDGSTYDTLMTLTPVDFLGQPCLYATVEVVDEHGRPGPFAS